MTDGMAEFERSWRRRFERFAQAHDDDARIAGWSDSGLAARKRCFLRAWARTPESSRLEARWLDAGAGAGTYTRLLASLGRQVTAMDYSIPTVQKAKQRTRDVTWLAADVTRLPFADGSFDGVLCFGVMQALSSPHDALREIRRVLVPGGVLWVDALNARCIAASFGEVKRRWRKLPAHLRYDEPRDFEAALRASRFGAIELHWTPIAPGRARVLQPIMDTSVVTRMLKAIPGLGSGLSHSMLLRAQAT
jgi:ubiquinone/menaquinone biosynthesis C-methylase UbiE